MSELKVHKAYNRWIDEEMPTPNDDLICNEVYLKSEADKVIAEKDAVIAELKAKLEGAKKKNWQKTKINFCLTRSRSDVRVKKIHNEIYPWNT